MTELFLDIVNMSISAGWLVLAVLALRFILKKAPKWVNVLLWGIVAVRLICPFSIESALSLIPSRETISPEIMMDWTPEISTGIEPLDQVVNPVISTSFAPNPGTSANPLQILIPVAANLWLLGVLILLAYTAISYLSLRLKLRTAVILRDNIFQCETVSSPFVLGILKPKIYLPYSIDGNNLNHVVAHEQAHIKRKDHWWKPLGFLLLSIYWFNPLMWVAYILLCRDIELACDEKVIKELGNEQRADYTQALVVCSVNRRMIAACPLTFGEVGVKERVKSVMNYKKPAFWIVVLAVATCIIVAICFLTNPAAKREFPINGRNVSTLDGTLYLDTGHESTIEARCGVMDGEITSQVDGSKQPTVDDQSNFGTGYGYQYGATEGTIEIFMNDKWWIFATEEAQQVIQFPATETEFSVNFAGNTSLQQEFDLTDDRPYWCILVENHSTEKISTEIGGEVRKIEPGTFDKIFSDEKGKPGSYSVSFATSGSSGMTGNAVCYTYKYRIEITGRLHNAVKDTTYILLTNIEGITFEQAWKASGLSSNMDDYFDPADAVFIGIR